MTPPIFATNEVLSPDNERAPAGNKTRAARMEGPTWPEVRQMVIRKGLWHQPADKAGCSGVSDFAAGRVQVLSKPARRTLLTVPSHLCPANLRCLNMTDERQEKPIRWGHERETMRTY
jgi:hypothetical protein